MAADGDTETDKDSIRRKNRERYPDIATLVDLLNAPFDLDEVEEIKTRKGVSKRKRTVNYPNGFNVRVTRIRTIGPDEKKNTQET